MPLNITFTLSDRDLQHFQQVIDRAKSAEAGQALIFMHTGGTPALFAYEKELSAAFATQA